MAEGRSTLALLFSYGSLQQPEVQQATFGRLLSGRPYSLTGYRLTPLPISDPGVVRLSGKAIHTIASATGDPDDRIAGMVFEVSEDELAATDRYEVDAYARGEVLLESGARAFAYLAALERSTGE